MANAIYCISGLGADERIFANLKIEGHEIKFVPWITTLPNEGLQGYATRMAAVIDEASPIILGVSFGGMVAIEIAKVIPVSKLIIISSVKSKAEVPDWMKWAGKLRLHQMIPIKNYSFTEPYRNYRLGITTKEEVALVNGYRKNADVNQVKWSIHQILNWNNTTYPDTIFHIHGDKDRLFPIRKTKPTHIIKGGTHMMIINRTKEIGECIKEIVCL